MMFMHSIYVKNDAEVKRGILSFFSFKMMFKSKYLPFYPKTYISFSFGENKNSKWKEKIDRVHTYIFGEISDTDTVIISVTQHKHVYIRESS